jgi:hypothetical protein
LLRELFVWHILLWWRLLAVLLVQLLLLGIRRLLLLLSKKRVLIIGCGWMRMDSVCRNRVGEDRLRMLSLGCGVWHHRLRNHVTVCLNVLGTGRRLSLINVVGSVRIVADMAIVGTLGMHGRWEWGGRLGKSSLDVGELRQKVEVGSINLLGRSRSWLRIGKNITNSVVPNGLWCGRRSRSPRGALGLNEGGCISEEGQGRQVAFVVTVCRLLSRADILSTRVW